MRHLVSAAGIGWPRSGGRESSFVATDKSFLDLGWWHPADSTWLDRNL